MNHDLKYPAIILVAIAFLTLGETAFAQPIYQVVDLAPVLSTEDSGKAVNSSGAVAFTESTQVYIYKNGVVNPVNRVAAGNGPLSMNDAGDLAGGNNLQGFFYKNGILQSFGGSNITFGQGINNSDIVVGEQYNQSLQAYRAFTWQSGVLHPLPGPVNGNYNSGDGSAAYSINNGGAIAGSYNNAYADGSAMVWSANLNAEILPTLGGFARGEAYGINNNGAVVGYSADVGIQHSQAVMWVNSVAQALPSPPGFSLVFANAINDNNEAVGWATNASTSQGGDAVAWFSGTLDDLNTSIPANSGWHLTDAEALNDSGYITGWGYLNGKQESYLLIPLPEPGLTMLLLFVSCATSLRRQRKHPKTPDSSKSIAVR